MKRIPLAALLAIAVLHSPSAQTKDEKARRDLKAEQELVKLETEFYEAYAKGDVDKIEQLLAKDYTHNDIRGGRKSRAAYMQYINALADSIKSSAIKIDSSDLAGLRVRVYENTAIATALWTARGTSGGKPDVEQLRFIHIWVKRLGRWQAVAGQVTPVAK